MTLRKWIYLFWTTLALGTAVGTIVGIGILLADPQYSFLEGYKPGLNALNLIFAMIAGAMLGVFSQMGFFSYLIMRYLVLGILRSNRVWEIIQLFLIAVALFDLIYLRYGEFEEPAAYTIGMPIAVFAVSLAVSWRKMQLTNRTAFVPTLFFMFVVTLLEAVPALREASIPSHILMFATLLVGNAWQILQLHKLVDPPVVSGNTGEQQASSLSKGERGTSQASAAARKSSGKVHSPKPLDRRASASAPKGKANHRKKS